MRRRQEVRRGGLPNGPAEPQQRLVIKQKNAQGNPQKIEEGIIARQLDQEHESDEQSGRPMAQKRRQRDEKWHDQLDRQDPANTPLVKPSGQKPQIPA